MLETTLATSFVVGSNLKGQVADANWIFLLPNLNLERVVCLGEPPLTTLKTLSRLSREVTVVCSTSRRMNEMSKVIEKSGLTNVRLIAINGNPLLPLPNYSVDLVLMVDRLSPRQFTRDWMLLAELQRLLKPEGLIYFESGGLVERLRGDKSLTDLTQDSGKSSIFWLTPTNGKMQTAVPLHDGEMINYFVRHKLYSPSFNLKMLNRAERFLSRRSPFSRFIQRYGVLMGGTAANPTDQPPQYLRAIAQEAGVDLDNYRWGLSARGKYNSRKVLFFLFNRASGAPEYIVKMTRDSTFNPRLENEYQALRLLQEQGIGTRETLPQVVFCGRHNKLAVVGETAIEGAPFRQRTQATADCPYAHAAIDWLTELGASTANSTAATPEQVAEGLEKLFTQFTQTYLLTPDERAFLVNQMAIIAYSREKFPLVFQHGDPGTWNVMVTPSGQVAFLDWEAAEPLGMPLWDLFYFIRSYSTWVARIRGTRDSLKGFTQQILVESPLSSLLIESTRRYCERTHLSEQLVKPLFYTCWMHRALKEATRLPLAKLDNGHYINLLKLCIAQRSAPTLDRLFLS